MLIFIEKRLVGESTCFGVSMPSSEYIYIYIYIYMYILLQEGIRGDIKIKFLLPRIFKLSHRKQSQLSVWVFYIALHSYPIPLKESMVMAFCDMLQKSQKQLTNISPKQFVALSDEF